MPGIVPWWFRVSPIFKGCFKWLWQTPYQQCPGKSLMSHWATLEWYSLLGYVPIYSWWWQQFQGKTVNATLRYLWHFISCYMLCGYVTLLCTNICFACMVSNAPRLSLQSIAMIATFRSHTHRESALIAPLPVTNSSHLKIGWNPKGVSQPVCLRGFWAVRFPGISVRSLRWHWNWMRPPRLCWGRSRIL